MIHYRDLTKLFIRSLQFNKANHRGSKFFFWFLMIFCILFIFLPFLAIFTIFIFDMMHQLNDVNFANVGFEVLIGIISIFIFVFSFHVLLNELYLSDDVKNLLPLPVKPEVLVASKFSSCFVVENIVLFLFLLFACGAYVVALNLPITHLILSFIGILLIPLAPMVYCTLISILFMYFFRKFVNKKALKKIGYVLITLLIVSICLILWKLSTFDFEGYVATFADGDHRLLKVLQIIFPSIHFFVDGLDKGSILSVIVSIIINMIIFGVMILCSKKFYYDGLLTVSSLDTDDKKSSLKLRESFNVKTPFMSYLQKEVRFLFRSPTFFVNCILINIIWPIFLFLIFRMGMPSYTIMHMRELLVEGDSSIFITLFICLLGVSIMVPAFNSIASSSYSREGKNFLFVKYIPLSYGIQWRVKFLISVLISFIGVNFFAIIFYILLRLNFFYILLFLLFSLLCIILVSFIGLLIDSMFPKLIWEDEADALRENYNAFIAMGFSLLFFGILCGGGYVLYHNYAFSFFALVLFAFSILVIMDLILYWLCNKFISYFIIHEELV